MQSVLTPKCLSCSESSAERIFVSTYSCSLPGGLSLTEGTLPWGCSCSTSGCRRCCSSECGEWNELLAGRLPSLAAFYTLSCGLLLEHSTSQLVWFGLANEMEGFGHLTRCTNEVPPQALFYFLFLFSFSSSPLPLVAGDDSSSASCWEKFSPHGEGRGDLNHRPCQGVRTHLGTGVCCSNH